MSRKNARIRVFLSKREYQRISFAATESGASRSLLVLEAIRVGLCNPDLASADTERHCRLDVRVPEEFAGTLKNLAQASGLTQQAVLRQFLFRYVNTSSWKKLSQELLNGGAPVES